MEDIRNHKVTKAVEDITFINIAVTGVIANITKSFAQSALGHMMYDGVRTLFTQEAAKALPFASPGDEADGRVAISAAG